MKQQINKKLIFLMTIFGVILIAMQAISIRKANIDESFKKATSIAEVVKAGLTAHMVNGNMDQRSIFLNSISQIESIEGLWVVRGEKVNKQYGKANKLELPRDEIDNQVLKNGETRYNIRETFNKASIRITIPYKAEPTGNINCLECHDVNFGDTLGAVSIILDITELKEVGILNIFVIVILTIIVSWFIIYSINKVIIPYLHTLELVNKKLEESTSGTFKEIKEVDVNTPKEAKTLIQRYNTLTKSLKSTFIDIDRKLKSFVGSSAGSNKNPFIESNEIITNLSHLYQYKKEIQLDKNKGDIYNRLGQVFTNKFNIKYLNVFEINEFKKIAKVYSMNENNFCFDCIKDNPIECRVSRNDSDVFWVEYQHACPCFTSDKYYYCIDIEIGKASKMIFNFIFDTKEEFEYFKNNLSYIKSYIKETAPEVATKLLMAALENSAFRDELTGLYNRKFFV